MIEVQAMLDELSIGHENRLAWVNNCGSIKELTYNICRSLIDQGNEILTLPRLHQLALVSNCDAIEYARQHSMLAVLRIAAKKGSDLPHGTVETHTFSRRFGMLPQRSGAYCCIECINEDIKKEQFSWYRRQHHLTGVDWCPVHGCVLSVVKAQEPFSQSPHIWLSEDNLKKVDACEPSLPEEGFLHRYIQIACKLLERNRPFQVENIASLLASRAKKYDLRIGMIGQRSLISDRLLDIAPIEWLRRHLPEFDTKITKVFFHRIDSLALYNRCAGAGDAYIMAIAALYESVDEAINDLALVDKNVVNKQKQNRRRGVQFWEGEIWPEYLQANGIYSEIASNLSITRQHLSERLNDLGLPSLRDIDNSPVWRTFERFMSGESFSISCTKEKINQDEFEKQLRICSGRVYKAMKWVRQKKKE